MFRNSVKLFTFAQVLVNQSPHPSSIGLAVVLAVVVVVKGLDVVIVYGVGDTVVVVDVVLVVATVLLGKGL